MKDLKVGDSIAVEFLASDFIDNYYTNTEDCALHRALTRKFNLTKADDLVIGGNWDGRIDFSLGGKGGDFKVSEDKPFNGKIFKAIRDRIEAENIKSSEVVYETVLTII